MPTYSRQQLTIDRIWLQGEPTMLALEVPGTWYTYIIPGLENVLIIDNRQNAKAALKHLEVGEVDMFTEGFSSTALVTVIQHSGHTVIYLEDHDENDSVQYDVLWIAALIYPEEMSGWPSPLYIVSEQDDGTISFVKVLQ